MIEADIKAKKHGSKCSLIIDGLAIKKQADWDPKLKTFSGPVPEPPPNASSEERANFKEQYATECAVTMLVGVDRKWKSAPTGYEFTNHSSAEQQANYLIEHLILAHKYGIDILAIVFDGLAANLATAELLGANLDLENHQWWFPHPVTGKKVYIIVDAVHMMKLMRNLIGEKKLVWIPGYHDPWSWDHYVALYEQQTEIGLKAGNKITKIHIYYERNKMKVYPAVQLLSTSTADSLQVEMDDGVNTRLEKCQPTIFVTRILDCYFDFCNTRSAKGFGQKEPITLENFERKKKQILEIISILQDMKIKEWRVNPKTKKMEQREILVRNSNKKTAIVGFTTTVKSLFDIAWELLNDKDQPMDKVYTYYFVQDFIEHMFSIFRLCGGWNSNPSPLQVKYIVRKMISFGYGGIHPSLNGNCSYLYVDIEIDEDEDNTEDFHLELEMEQQAECYSDYLMDVDYHFSSMKDFKKRILAYIAGYVALKLCKRVVCLTCRSALQSSPADLLDSSLAALLNQKNRKSKNSIAPSSSANLKNMFSEFNNLTKKELVIPSQSVYELVAKAESVFQVKVAKPKTLPQQKNLIKFLTADVLRVVSLTTLFPTLNQHILQQMSPAEEPHNLALAKLVITRYLEVRCKSFCKVVNDGFSTLMSSKNRNLKLSHNKHE